MEVPSSSLGARTVLWIDFSAMDCSILFFPYMKVLLLLPLRMDTVDSKDHSHTSQQKDCRKKNSPQRISKTFGDVAQLGEHRLCKAGVRGSSPLVSIV